MKPGSTKIAVVIGKERKQFGRYAVGSHVRNATIFWLQHYIESVVVLVRVLQYCAFHFWLPFRLRWSPIFHYCIYNIYTQCGYNRAFCT